MPQCFNFEWELELTPYNNKLFSHEKLGTSFYGWGKCVTIGVIRMGNTFLFNEYLIVYSRM